MTDGWLQPEVARPAWLAAFVVLLPLLLWSSRSLVRLPAWQRQASLLTRCTILTLLILAVSGLGLLQPASDVYVVFAIDQSDSISGTAQRTAQEFLEQATAGADPTNWTVLGFAESPGEILPGDRTLPPRPDSAAGDGAQWRNGTDLSAAIDSARAAVPPGRVPRLVLLSDGNPTRGDAATAAASAGMRILSVPLASPAASELELTAVELPAQVPEGQPFHVHVVVTSGHDDEVLIELFRGDQRTAAATGTVRPGENRFTFTEQVEQPTRFTARVTPLPRDASDDQSSETAPTSIQPDSKRTRPDMIRDTRSDNNQNSGLVFTSGQPRVLMIDPAPDQARSLAWALAKEDIRLDVRTPEGLPQSLADLLPWQVLILSNTPASELSPEQMEMIRTWVADTGGGLLMLGGDRSFGQGGWFDTPVDAIFPVRSDFEKERERPGLGMVLVIDKSGSMGGQKIELAKVAARGAVELLGPKDQVGILAFDGVPNWVAEIQSASRREPIIDRIASIRPDGGTALFPALATAFEALRRIPARLKHVIVLTDGYSTPGDFDAVTSRMAAARITVSTVGTGDADRVLLQRIAAIGGGRYYFTDDPSSIPQIFARETLAAGKASLNEEPFLPIPVRSTAVLSGIDLDDAPFLLGYVVTQARPTAELILVTEEGDPLLAWWRYGLGMTAAFTSDAGPRWAAEWIAWEDYSRFWAQLIRHCMKPPESGRLATEITVHGDTTRVSVDAFDDAGQYLNDAETTVTLIDPELTTRTLSLPQSAPGRYESETVLDKPGTWLMQITQQRSGRILHQQSRGIVVRDTSELSLRPVNTSLLQALADTTGGTLNPDPSDVFAPHATDRVIATIPLWPWLVGAALLLFVLDVGLRRYRKPETSVRE